MEEMDNPKNPRNLDWCEAVGRDYGEETGNFEARVYDDLTALMKTIKDSWAEYLYIWDCRSSKWKFTDLYDKTKKDLKPLTMKDCKDKR
jgi:hypothetical protein